MIDVDATLKSMVMRFTVDSVTPGIQKRVHGLHSLRCKTFRVGWKRQTDDQIVTGIVFPFVFGFFVGDEFCHGLRSPGCGFAVPVEIRVFDVEVERGDVIAVDHLLVASARESTSEHALASSVPFCPPKLTVTVRSVL